MPEIFYAMKKKLVIVCMVMSVALSSSAAFAKRLDIPESYFLPYTLLVSLVVTSYFTTMDANQQSADVGDWQIDFTTLGNIIWRTALFGLINNAERTVQEQTAVKGNSWAKSEYFRLGLIKTTAAMFTYNTRYDITIIKRYQDFVASFQEWVDEGKAATLAAGSLLVTNVLVFYTVPLLWSSQVTAIFKKHTPIPKIVGSDFATKYQSVPIGFMAFAVTDLISTHILISLKHTITGMLPSASDLGLLRFPECTSCYFLTNPFGKSRALGGPLYDLRNTVWEMLSSMFTDSIFTESIEDSSLNSEL
jgi:hypothetical protein